MKRSIWLAPALLAAGPVLAVAQALAATMPASPPSASAASPATAHFHWRPAADDGQPRPWAILLPGASGLAIGADTSHYFRSADRLRAMGVDVLLVHYQAASPLLPDTRQGRPGPRIARVVQHAVADMRRQGRMPATCPGAIVGWSLGGEGVWALAAAPTTVTGLRAAVAFYPSVAGQQDSGAPQVPVLVLQGVADRITAASRLDRQLARTGWAANVTVERYAGAGHGFDVASLTTPTRIGGATLLHDAAATDAAWLAIARMLRVSGVADGHCS